MASARGEYLLIAFFLLFSATFFLTHKSTQLQSLPYTVAVISMEYSLIWASAFYEYMLYRMYIRCFIHQYIIYKNLLIPAASNPLSSAQHSLCYLQSCLAYTITEILLFSCLALYFLVLLCYLIKIHQQLELLLFLRFGFNHIYIVLTMCVHVAVGLQISRLG